MLLHVDYGRHTGIVEHPVLVELMAIVSVDSILFNVG